MTQSLFLRHAHWHWHRNATLAPPQAIAASDRGTRTLTEWERQRVAEIYRKGYASRTFSDCFVDTSTASVAACAADIARRIQ